MILTRVGVGGSSTSGYTVVLGGELQDLVPLALELREREGRNVWAQVITKLSNAWNDCQPPLHYNYVQALPYEFTMIARLHHYYITFTCKRCYECTKTATLTSPLHCTITCECSVWV